MYAESQAVRREVAPRGDPFVVYVEGPRDREILNGWIQRRSPGLARALGSAWRILGGRQPERAVSDFRAVRARAAGARALCVLDRDRDAGAHPGQGEPGLEFFTWSRRHIESYLLVPDAIRRALRLPPHDSRVARFFQSHLPGSDDEPALSAIDAKRVLAREGPLARAVGRNVPAGRIARSMHEAELHSDIHELLGRLRAGLGVL